MTLVVVAVICLLVGVAIGVLFSGAIEKVVEGTKTDIQRVESMLNTRLQRIEQALRGTGAKL